METISNRLVAAVESAERTGALPASIEARTNAAAQPALGGQRSFLEKMARALVGIASIPFLIAAIAFSLPLSILTFGFSKIIKSGGTSVSFLPFILTAMLTDDIFQFSGFIDSNPTAPEVEPAVSPAPVLSELAAAPTPVPAEPAVSTAPVLSELAAAPTPVPFASTGLEDVDLHKLAIRAASGDLTARDELQKAARTSTLAQSIKTQLENGEIKSVKTLKMEVLRGGTLAATAHNVLFEYFQRFDLPEAAEALRAIAKHNNSQRKKVEKLKASLRMRRAAFRISEPVLTHQTSAPNPHLAAAQVLADVDAAKRRRAAGPERPLGVIYEPARRRG